MDPALSQLITALHQVPLRLVLAITGGGTTAAAWLLSLPGGSRTVLEIIVPYDEQALSDYLGCRPESFCSASTSRALARRARERARWLSEGTAAVGVGCTASLRSGRPKQGEHRAHLSLDSAAGVTTWSLILNKDARERAEEENVVARLLLNALAETLGVRERVSVPLLPGEEIHTEAQAADPLTLFLQRRQGVLCVEPDGRMRTHAPPPKLLLSGSFNPLHAGHCSLAEVAGRLHNAAAAFELGVSNADKPSLTEEEVRRRLRQFAWHAPLWLTHAPTFAEKATLFPGVVFVVGADTAARIVAPRFYDNSETRMREALHLLRQQGCRFLVAGRLSREGTFLGVDGLNLPEDQRDLFAPLAESVFRHDISSTELRQQSSALPDEPRPGSSGMP